MITFFVSIAALVLGYVFYGKLMENIFGADKNRETPVMSMNDGVDYMPLPKWKNFSDPIFKYCRPRTYFWCCCREPCGVR